MTVQPRPSHTPFTAEGAIGAEALATVQYNPTLELVLLELGNGNASAACRHTQQLRSIRRDLRIVALSVSGGSRQVVEAIRLGAQDYLNVPLQDDGIAASAQTLFGTQQSSD